ncbi:hypothetical protein ACFL3T_03830 [Patescibacteria group bacterium]
MADNKQKIGGIAPEAPKPQAPEAPKQRQEAKEVKEASISVGLEAGEIIEGAEEVSGHVSESEQKRKEGDTGVSMTQSAGSTAGTPAKPAFPPVTKMTFQVKKQLKKDMKVLNKKVKHVMRQKGPIDAENLNKLVEALRELKRLLSNLASATADTIRNLWITHVKERNKS